MTAIDSAGSHGAQILCSAEEVRPRARQAGSLIKDEADPRLPPGNSPEHAHNAPPRATQPSRW